MSLPIPDAPTTAPAIEVRGISKSYARDLRQAQRNGVAAILAELHQSKGAEPDRRAGEFWAVRNVSFQVQPGEAVGIVGRNGAGKTTLLRLVAGISRPTSGDIVRRGTVATLLDPSAGFNPVLTGRENVEVTFTLLAGRPPDASVIDDIVAYAGVEEAIDHPVRTYSQGMRLRLGFSSMVHVDPDVLIIDEALAVGDTSFQLQCLEYLRSYIRAGGALLFVSHSLWLFQGLATTGIHLESGRIALAGSSSAVADHYVAALQRGSWVDSGDGPDIMDRERPPAPRPPVSSPTHPPGTSEPGAPADCLDAMPGSPGTDERPVWFEAIDVTGPDGASPVSGAATSVCFEIRTSRAVQVAELAYTVWSADLSVCVLVDRARGFELAGADGAFAICQRRTLRCRIDSLPLTPGRYGLRAAVYDQPTSDVLGMIGFEDAPIWFEVERPEGSTDVPNGPAEPQLRPLRSIETQAAIPQDL